MTHKTTTLTEVVNLKTMNIREIEELREQGYFNITRDIDKLFDEVDIDHDARALRLDGSHKSKQNK